MADAKSQKHPSTIGGALGALTAYTFCIGSNQWKCRGRFRNAMVLVATAMSVFASFLVAPKLADKPGLAMLVNGGVSIAPTLMFMLNDVVNCPNSSLDSPFDLLDLAPLLAYPLLIFGITGSEEIQRKLFGLGDKMTEKSVSFGSRTVSAAQSAGRSAAAAAAAASAATARHSSPNTASSGQSLRDFLAASAGGQSGTAAAIHSKNVRAHNYNNLPGKPMGVPRMNTIVIPGEHHSLNTATSRLSPELYRPSPGVIGNVAL
ncbi:hypothetical protein JKP88DRAFT_273032 [Tribonema minus]|uniref:Uncharacterized protein n=1 Tax=Tribonema minus TaxID=303371 RepID=A0A835YX45_9STRA|nr:hypothetical protein JKP88DRAFT_273032 [Tribonema minus]